MDTASEFPPNHTKPTWPTNLTYHPDLNNSDIPDNPDNSDNLNNLKNLINLINLDNLNNLNKLNKLNNLNLNLPSFLLSFVQKTFYTIQTLNRAVS